MHQHSILVVEDQPDLREILTAKLTAAGFGVTTVENGRAASRALAMGKFDLVLTDIIMPEKDGLEIMTELAKHPSGPPVIAMSGGGKMPAHFYLKMARRLGAAAILEKPFSHDQLMAAIALALPACSG